MKRICRNELFSPQSSAIIQLFSSESRWIISSSFLFSNSVGGEGVRRHSPSTFSWHLNIKQTLSISWDGTLDTQNPSRFGPTDGTGKGTPNDSMVHEPSQALRPSLGIHCTIRTVRPICKDRQQNDFETWWWLLVVTYGYKRDCRSTKNGGRACWQVSVTFLALVHCSQTINLTTTTAHYDDMAKNMIVKRWWKGKHCGGPTCIRVSDLIDTICGTN